ncbi:hypothetical protein LP419_14760 [Massilia sp. H-1]|nr:hypothetical protein LP419_14760 [Massilia sp. H-1]
MALLPRRTDGHRARHRAEFNFKVAAFHHAAEAYKIAPLLKASGTCAAMWADWYGFKLESFDGIRENIAIVDAVGACATLHSDDETGIQMLNQEAAKAMAAGRRAGLNIAPERAIVWLTANPARASACSTRSAVSIPASRPTWCCGAATRSRSTRRPTWSTSTVC